MSAVPGRGDDANSTNADDVASGSEPGASIETPLDQLAAMDSGDTAGSDTFRRYRYQAKVAVQRWLQSMADDTIVAIACEFVDDVTTVTTAEIRFAQLKTRDRGAWTVARIFSSGGGGIDSLVRSYKMAVEAGCVDRVRLELVLEGPSSETKADREFFDDPTSASKDVRSKLVALGIPTGAVDDFLSRLSVRLNFFSRDTIDAVTLRSLMAMFTSLSGPEIDALYESLLRRAEAAQEGMANAPTTWQGLLEPQTENEHTLTEHVLTRADLIALLPPTSETLAERLRTLESLDGPSAASRLELKLIAAGATRATVENAMGLRADAAFRLAETGASPEIASQMSALADRVLTHARAAADQAELEGHTNTAVAHKQGQFIWLRLVQDAANLIALDVDSLFGGSHLAVLGYLCELSDECRFMWSAA